MDWVQISRNTRSSMISPTTIAYALAALGLAVHFGYAGLLNLGLAGFMAARRLRLRHLRSSRFGFPVVGGVLVGARRSVIFALILGIPTLRLRGDYLAIVTIAAAEVVRLLSSRRRRSTTSPVGRRPAAATSRASAPRTRSRRAPTASVRGSTTRPAGGCASSACIVARHRRAARLAAHAQPVGPRAQGHPGGRGCRARARQERLLLQDAGAHPRRRDRRRRRHRLRAASAVSPGVLRHRR